MDDEYRSCACSSNILHLSLILMPMYNTFPSLLKGDFNATQLYNPMILQPRKDVTGNEPC
jgi:hypothetical protein